MGRPPCCDKSNVKRGLWTAEEDAKILAYVANHGTGNWTLVPKKAGLNRCGKSCRLRWTNYLRPDLKHESFTPQEEEIIINLHKAIGSRWSLIAKKLPGRTDNDVKNYWNTKLRKKLYKMGIDPVTHKPFSQIFSDFGNISGIPNSVNHFGRNINTFMSMKPKAELIQDNLSFTNNPSRDFLAQVQIPNQETIQPHFFSEVSSSCSSSSSPTIVQFSSPTSHSCQPSQAQAATPSSPSSWSEFLIYDPHLSMDFQKQPELEPQRMLSSANSNLTEDQTSGCIFNSNNENDFREEQESYWVHYNYEDIDASQGINRCANVSASSTNSFVDAILNKDSEMSSQFFALLDGSFDQ